MKKVIPLDAVLVPSQAQIAFSGVIYDVYQWQQEMYDGSFATFEMLKRPDTVQAICVVNGKLLVLEEEQPHRGTRLSLAGGRVDKTDISLLSAVKREIHEETGYNFENWRLVLVKQPHTKIEWFIHIFLAWGVKEITNAHIDGGEKIKIRKMSLKEVKDLSQRGIKYLNDAQELLLDVSTIDDLVGLLEFQGQEVDR